MQPAEWQNAGAGSPPPDDRFADLVRRHWMPLYRYCRSLLGDGHLAEDAVQETFLRTYRSAAKIEPSKMAGWLFTVARRCCLEMARNRQRLAARESAAAEAGSAGGAPDGLDAIRDAVESLDADDRELIVLKHTAGFKCRQIAEMTGRPLGTVCSSLAKAYRKLRERLAKGQR